MEDDRPYRATVSVNLVDEFSILVEPDDIPDGQTVEDVAHARALDAVIDGLEEGPGAYITVDDIEDVDDE